MKSIKNPIYLIIFCGAPQLLLLIFTLLRFGNEIFSEALFGALFVALFAAVPIMSIIAALKKDQTSCIKLLAMMLVIQIVSAAFLLKNTYSMAAGSNMPIESAMLCLFGLSALFICVQLYLIKSADKQEKLGLTFLLGLFVPLACAALLNDSMNIDTAFLNIGIALFCSALVFFIWSPAWTSLKISLKKQTASGKKSPKSLQMAVR